MLTPFSRLNHKPETLRAVSSNPALACVVNLLPEIRLFESQHADPNISNVIKLKEQDFPPPLHLYGEVTISYLLTEIAGMSFLLKMDS